MGEEPLVGGLAQGQVQPHLLLRDAQALAERRDVRRQQRGLAGRAERQADVGRADDLARQHAQRPGRSACRTWRRPWSASCRAAGPPWPASPRAAHRPWRAPTRSATGSTSSFHTGRVASTHSARLQATARAGAGRQRRRAVQPQVGQPHGLLDRGALGGADARVLGAVRRCPARPSGGRCPWPCPSSPGRPRSESIWPSCWKAAPRSLGFREPNIAAKRIVAPPAPPAPPPKPNGFAGALTATALAGPSSCPRRRPPAPPAEGRIRMGCHSRVSSARRAAGSVRRRLPDITIQRRHLARSGLGASPTRGLRQDGCHLVRTRHSRTY